MINKNKKWIAALSVAVMIAANGIAMAAVSDDKQDASVKKPAAAAEKSLKHRHMRKVDNTELLALLKIDADSFKKEMKAGKSLLTIAKEHGVSETTLKELLSSK